MFSLGVPHPPKVKADGGAQTNEEQGPLSTEFPLESHDSKSMTDPLQVVPKELFLEMLSFVSVKDVAQNCSLVCRAWCEASNSTQLWREFLYKLHIAQQAEASVSVEYLVDRHGEIDKIERDEQGLENGQKYLGGAQYERLNEWKKYYAWKAGFGHWRWQIENTEDNYNLHVSEDRLTCSLPPQKATHANAWGEFGWNKGVHKWKVRMEGMNADGFWAALGVTSEPNRHFVYRSSGVFTGFSAAGNLFSQEREETQGVMKRWTNGDVITLSLDCNKHTLSVWINDYALPVLPTLDSTLWPWANIYVHGGSFTLLHQ